MKIYVAGHLGMVGSAICRQITAQIAGGRHDELLVRTRHELDLTNQNAVRNFMQENKPDLVIIAAAKVGGIHANNTFPADFMYQNLMIECNLIHESYSIGVQKLLFLGSSCIYPRLAQQPMSENSLLTGLLEPTNEPYAVSKISGIKLCESYNRQFGTDYRSVMPTNLYGPKDNFHPTDSHVVPALIRRFHEAKMRDIDEVVIWGSGSARREFLHVEDMASGALFVLGLDRKIYESNTEPMISHINVGSNIEICIADLARLISDVTGYQGQILFDSSKPDGAPRKLMSSALINKMGWKSTIDLAEGLANTYAWYLNSHH
jgi:nucleoside-diphosphate-sugar epimerase